MYKSKGFRKFISRLKNFEEDIETLDVFCKNMPSFSLGPKIFDGVTTRHPNLNKRSNSQHNRILVSTHLKHTLYVSLIKEIYEELMLYLGYILTCGALSSVDPTRLVGNDQKINMTANDILSLDSKEDIVTRIMRDIFRKLENKRDTLLLIKELNERLGLDIENEIIDEAMPYLQARHKFVHADGLVDDSFKNSYPNIKLTDDNCIKLDRNIMKSAFLSIKNLADEIEKKMSSKHYFQEVEYK